MNATPKSKKLDEKQFYKALKDYEKELRQSTKLKFTKIEEKFKNLTTNKSNPKIKGLNEDLKKNNKQKKKLLSILIQTISSSDNECDDVEEQKTSSDYYSLSGSSSETSVDTVSDNFHPDLITEGEPHEDEYIPVTEIDKWCEFSANETKSLKHKNITNQSPTRRRDLTELNSLILGENAAYRKKESCKKSGSGRKQKNKIHLNQDNKSTMKGAASERFLVKEANNTNILRSNKVSTCVKNVVMQENATLDIRPEEFGLNCQLIRKSARLKEKEKCKIVESYLATDDSKGKKDLQVKQKLCKEKRLLQSPLAETETGCGSVSVQSSKITDVNASCTRRKRERPNNNVPARQELELFVFPIEGRSSQGNNKHMSSESRAFKKTRKKTQLKPTLVSTEAGPSVVSKQAAIDESVIGNSFVNRKKKLKHNATENASSYIKDMTNKIDSSRYLILKKDWSIVVSLVQRKSDVLYVLPLNVKQKSNYVSHEVSIGLNVLNMCSNFHESSQKQISFEEQSIGNIQTYSEHLTTGVEMIDERDMHTNIQSAQICNTAAPVRIVAESLRLTQTETTNELQVHPKNNLQCSFPSHSNLPAILEEESVSTELDEVELENECLYTDKVDSLSQTQNLNNKSKSKAFLKQKQATTLTRMEAHSHCTLNSNNIHSNAREIRKNKSILLPDKPLENLINCRKKISESSTGKDVSSLYTLKAPNLSKSTDLPPRSYMCINSKTKKRFGNLKPDLPPRGHLKDFLVDKCALQSDSYEPHCKILRDDSNGSSSEVIENFKMPFLFSTNSVARRPLESSKGDLTATHDSTAPANSSCIDYSFFVEDEHTRENSVISEGSFSLYSKTLREVKKKYRKQEDLGEKMVVDNSNLERSLLPSYMSFVKYSQLHDASALQSISRSATLSSSSHCRSKNASTLKPNLWLKSMLSSEMESNGVFKW